MIDISAIVKSLLYFWMRQLDDINFHDWKLIQLHRITPKFYT